MLRTIIIAKNKLINDYKNKWLINIENKYKW